MNLSMNLKDVDVAILLEKTTTHHPTAKSVHYITTGKNQD
jgi:hypothetical protein